ncbi:hypothetical protein F441_02726 [Phytophthora nicotianae CJ01A1]|uniref:RxLR effector protein n=1 Tax=Phytophthora nicotianae CJ01A1 TaxID=1317063 RepID=W2XMY2_PHYNI|nr:hypothetical protein F441_02726 [Phytophthora nicotianae CJ01A1]
MKEDPNKILLKDINTRSTAYNLLQAQMEQWKISRKTAEEVVTLLKLTEDGSNFLNSPVLKAWVSLVEKLKEDPYELMFSKLMKFYNAHKLALLLRWSSVLDITGTTSKLEEFQCKFWKESGKSADDIFERLRLNQKSDGFLNNPVSQSYSDEGLAKMLIAAKKDSSTTYIAERLEDVHLQYFQENGKTTEDVHKFLRLDEEDKAMFLILQKKYGNKRLAEMASQAEDGSTTNSGLKEERNLLVSPAFSTWSSYVTKLNSSKEEPNDLAIIVYLERPFGGFGLARMLDRSQQSPNRQVQEDAEKLQTLQLKHWMNHHSDTIRMLNYGNMLDETDTRISIVYKKFFQAKNKK